MWFLPWVLVVWVAKYTTFGKRFRFRPAPWALLGKFGTSKALGHLGLLLV